MSFVAATAATTAEARPPQPAQARAVDGVFAAFQRHSVVLLSDAHGLAQEGAFYADLVRDPRFARTVGNVVVEFGGAAHQDTLDRYLSGEVVPYATLRSIWTDVVGWEAPPSQMYSNFFAAVRDVNARLPPNQQVHVYLGEPPIDWAKVHTFNELQPFMRDRDRYPAGIVNREILDRGRKALVIYGPAHFLAEKSPFGPNLRVQIEQAHPGSTYLVVPYSGYDRKGCSARLESRSRSWPVPGLIDIGSGTWLARTMTECANDAGFRFRDPADVARARKVMSGASADALLYLGPVKTLRRDPADPSLFLDLEYVADWNRTRSCCLPPGVGVIDPGSVVRANTAASQGYRPQ